MNTQKATEKNLLGFALLALINTHEANGNFAASHLTCITDLHYRRSQIKTSVSGILKK